ncbi:MAG: prepilin peptidase [Acidobacteria bacterium]|nr:MAG: prepilin peptidase [Acidobacteriota bacterium]
MHSWTLAVLGAGAAAAFWDLRWRTIPRTLCVLAFGAGLIYHTLTGDLGSAVAAAGAGFALGAILFQVGAVGGGDVKWLTAMGALLGWHLWFWSVEFGLIAAALGAIGQVALRGRLLFLGQDVVAIVREWRRHGLRPHPEHNVNTPGAVTAPLAPALAVGLLCALLWL